MILYALFLLMLVKVQGVGNPGLPYRPVGETCGITLISEKGVTGGVTGKVGMRDHLITEVWVRDHLKPGCGITEVGMQDHLQCWYTGTARWVSESGSKGRQN